MEFWAPFSAIKTRAALRDSRAVNPRAGSEEFWAQSAANNSSSRTNSNSHNKLAICGGDESGPAATGESDSYANSGFGRCADPGPQSQEEESSDANTNTATVAS